MKTKIYNNDPKYFLRVAVGLFKRKKFEKALVFIKRVQKLTDVNIKLMITSLFLEGDVLHEMSEFSKAVKVYSKILEEEKNSIAYANRALAYWEMKKYKQALKDYLSAIKMDKKNYIAFRGAGEMLVKLNKSKRAVAYFRRALKINPKYAEANTALGIELYNFNEFSKAHKCFSEALKTDKANELAKRGIGLIENYFEMIGTK